MMVLQWRLPAQDIVVRWLGQDGRFAAAVAANPPAPVPTLIGPPGLPGPTGPSFDIAAAVIDGGTFF